MNHRAAGIIIKDGKILLLRRVRPDREYYVFPGGGVEEGETTEEALKREMKEELCIDVLECELFFQFENQSFFLIRKFDGTPILGGPEKERMNEVNQYYVEWYPISEISCMDGLYPHEAVESILKFCRI